MICFLYLLFSHLKFRAKVFTEFLSRNSGSDDMFPYLIIMIPEVFFFHASEQPHTHTHTGFSFNKETR